jgi:hypothetical protein
MYSAAVVLSSNARSGVQHRFHQIKDIFHRAYQVLFPHAVSFKEILEKDFGSSHPPIVEVRDTFVYTALSSGLELGEVARQPPSIRPPFLHDGQTSSLLSICHRRGVVMRNGRGCCARRLQGTG